MTIDEAIENYKKDSQFYNDKFEPYLAEEYKQLVEWLEELKAIKENNHDFFTQYKNDAYNKGRADEREELLEDIIQELDILNHQGGGIGDLLFYINQLKEKNNG